MRRRVDLRVLAPTLLAGVLATIYVILSPPSFDLAAHMLRAKLFDAVGFGVWNNWWYGGHHTPGYSVLFPAASALLSPQLAAAIAAAATAAVFEALARRHFGREAWLGAVWFGAATATNLFTGRLAFAFGLLPALATVLALQRGRGVTACALAVLTALCSPVAALFVALAGAAQAIGAYVGTHRRAFARPGLAVALAALVPVAALSLAFPEGGVEPFAFAALWPIPVIAAVTFAALGAKQVALRAGVLLYGLGCIASYAVASPIGGNVVRLGTLMGGPLAALIWWRRRVAWLVAAALPLLYLEWQAPVRDLRLSVADPSAQSGYYQPLLSFLQRQSGPPFRVEIPFTAFHWEAYVVADRFPIARGWERQLDIKDNHLFYGGTLSAATYRAWLEELGVRFVVVFDADLDYSGRRETELIDRGLPYLRLVMRSRHWRVYAVSDPAPIAQGDVTLRAFGPDSLTLTAKRPGPVFLRVRFTPYWKLAEGSGCVSPAGDFTRLTLHRAGAVKLEIDFSLARIRARSARCA